MTNQVQAWSGAEGDGIPLTAECDEWDHAVAREAGLWKSFYFAYFPFSSTRIRSIPLSSTFSGRWVPAVVACASPAFIVMSVFFPAASVNCTLLSVRATTTPAGWLCMIDFSCGP